MQHFRRILGYWLPLAVVASGICLFVYIAVQQNYRMNANDPQVQMAENASAELTAGVNPQEVLPADKVDIAANLSPFMIIYDDKGNVLASSALLDNQTPVYPEGALTAALKSGENRVTWQPRAGVRLATVVTAYKSANASGFVMVGRSLREVESRIDNLTLMLVLTWAGALVASLVMIIFSEYILLHPKEKAV